MIRLALIWAAKEFGHSGHRQLTASWSFSCEVILAPTAQIEDDMD